MSEWTSGGETGHHSWLQESLCVRSSAGQHRSPHCQLCSESESDDLVLQCGHRSWLRSHVHPQCRGQCSILHSQEISSHWYLLVWQWVWHLLSSSCISGETFFNQSDCIIVWCQYILEHHGWQWVMRLFSLLALVGAGAGLTMLPATPSSPATHESESRDHKTRVHSVDSRGSRVVSWVLGDELASHKKLLCYTVFTLSDFLSFCAIYIPYTHLPPLARSHGVQAGDAAFLISVGGICNTVGRFVGGWISDLPRVQALVVSTLSILVCSVPTTLLASCWSYWTFLVAFGSFGFLTGLVSTISSPFSTIIQES